jgi:hypothetical protein
MEIDMTPKATPTAGPSVYQPGAKPEMDAWFTAFLIENHLDYYTHPEHAASPEQVRFMVYADENDRYYPCSDEMFSAIMGRNQSAFLQKRYNAVLNRILSLVDHTIEEPYEKAYLESLIVVKYKHETRDEIMLPSRLEKRLLGVFIKATQIEDPFEEVKAAANRHAHATMTSDAIRTAFDTIDRKAFTDPPDTMAEVTLRVRQVELKRLLSMIVEPALWAPDAADSMTAEKFFDIFNRGLLGSGVDAFFEFIGVPLQAPGETLLKPKKILWLADESGEIVVDLFLIKYLVNLGHTVILSLKEGAQFSKATVKDTQEDEILHAELANALFVSDPNMGKNDLVRTLRSDHRIYILSDGTMEDLNLLLTSTTFARVFKEVDAVVTRGTTQRRRMFDTRFQFTQNVFNISAGPDGSPEVMLRERHPEVIKFSHKDLEAKAGTLIDQMEHARESGQTVMFYSGIIGSIPGKIEIAKNIMTTFIDHLKEQMAMIFIINPSTYYEPGMDADDLMYFWEIVQRSGFIDIWRFQTYEDIADAFQIMGQKVPPEWVGKDATFSTGCTKEMHIAVDVQRHHPEMQIIGPSLERFMRRKEYGVGKMYDKRLTDVRGV